MSHKSTFAWIGHFMHCLWDSMTCWKIKYLVVCQAVSYYVIQLATDVKIIMCALISDNNTMLCYCWRIDCGKFDMKFVCYRLNLFEIYTLWYLSHVLSILGTLHDMKTMSRLIHACIIDSGSSWHGWHEH